jgi:hypothetical protein
MPFGTTLPYTVAFNLNTTAFIANNNDGSYVLKYVEGMKYKEIPAPWLISFLSVATNLIDVIANSRGYFFRHKGELFYCLTFIDSSNALGSYKTFVCQLSKSIWTIFTAWYSWCSCPGTSANPVTFLGGNLGVGGQPTLATVGVTSLYNDVLAADYDKYDYYYNRNTGTPVEAFSTSITEQLYTNWLDFGVSNYKALHRASPQILRLNRSSGNDTLYITLSMRYNDLELISANSIKTNSTFTSAFPHFTQFGTFKNIQLAITNQAYNGGRGLWKFIEFDVNKGQQ